MRPIAEMYDRDFYAWAMKNAALLREGCFSDIDVEHMAEVLESMGRSERRELRSRLAVLLAHLLKWQYQPTLRSPIWRYTIREQRLAVAEVLEDNPSLQPQSEEVLHKAYQFARLIAARETGLGEEAFPGECPFSFERAMQDDFWPA